MTEAGLHPVLEAELEGLAGQIETLKDRFAEARGTERMAEVGDI